MNEERNVKTAKLKWTAATLAIIGGATSAVCGGAIWLGDWGWFFPWLGFAGFVLGMFIILGGILIINGRGVVGGNLALWCGIANMFSGAVGTLQVAFTVLRFIGLTGSTEAGFLVGYILTIAISVGFPVLGGILALISRGTKGEAI